MWNNKLVCCRLATSDLLILCVKEDKDRRMSMWFERESFLKLNTNISPIFIFLYLFFLCVLRENTKNPRAQQKRYSEGTLASDYSRTLDNMLKKNFVEWLLNRREHRIEWVCSSHVFSSVYPGFIVKLKIKRLGRRGYASKKAMCVSWINLLLP